MQCPNCQKELNENGICLNCNSQTNENQNVVVQPVENTIQTTSVEIYSAEEQTANTPVEVQIVNTPVEAQNVEEQTVIPVDSSNIEVQENKKKKNPILIIVVILLILAVVFSLVVFKPWTLLETNDKDQFTNNENNKEPVLNGNTTSSDDMIVPTTSADDVIVSVTSPDDIVVPEDNHVTQEPAVENIEPEDQTPSEKPKEENKEPEVQNPPEEEKEPEDQTPIEDEKELEGDDSSEETEEFNDLVKQLYVNFVRELMTSGITQFMTDALKFSAQNIAYTNLTVNNSFPTFELDKINDANYYIEFNRNGNIQRVLYYKDKGCYDSGNVSSLSKSDITINDIVESHPNDSINGCYNKN